MPRFKWPAGRRRVPEQSSAQSTLPGTTPIPNEPKKSGFLGPFKFRSTSRSPSPRPPSSASLEARANSPGQSEQRKPSKAPQIHGDVVTVPAGTSTRSGEDEEEEEGRKGQPQLTPGEEGDVLVAASAGPDEQHKATIQQNINEHRQQQQVAPHGHSDKEGDKGLWAKAHDKLPDELKQHLVLDKLQTLKNVLKTANDAKEANIANRLKLKWGDKEINVQEVADRLVGWIAKFKEVGDIAVQYDPVHAALPWAGVRFILLVRSTTSTL